MKYFYYLFFIVLFGCKSNEKQDEIIVFEYILGLQNTNVLNLLVLDFEVNLKKHYPNLSLQKAYEQYLKDSVNPNETNFEKFNFQTKNTQSKFLKSGFKNEIYTYYKEYDSIKRDSIIQLESNNVGKYMHALYAIRETDTLINTYWKKREAGGLMQKELIVDGLLHYKPNFNNYFHKRIVVVEYSF